MLCGKITVNNLGYNIGAHDHRTEQIAINGFLAMTIKYE